MGKDLNKYLGCLLGGAAGDALGYAVEFMSAEEIFVKYGENGIGEYELKDGKALISDDTQMTLFTANGLLAGTTLQQTGGRFDSYQAVIFLAYRDWLLTQQPGQSSGSICWLNSVPELNSRRAPGVTCLSALSSGAGGSVAAPVNNSKGCGGVMRVAPIGLYLPSLGMSMYDADMLAAEAAAITHGHPLGYISAAALAQIIGYTVNMPDSPLLHSVMSAKHAIGRLFPDTPETAEMTALIDRAIELSMMDMDDLDAIRLLGEGWVGEECLAIAIYCALKYSGDFDAALVAAVNHDGDSDSTGAVTGNILGAFLGLDAIPEKYLKNLELRDVIMEIAEDLYNDCPISREAVMADALWVEKYVKHDFRPGKTEAPAEKKAETAAKTHRAAPEKFDEVLDNQISLDEIIDAQEIKAEQEKKRREKQEAEARELDRKPANTSEKAEAKAVKAEPEKRAEEEKQKKPAEKPAGKAAEKDKEKKPEKTPAEKAPEKKQSKAKEEKPAPVQISISEAAASSGVMKFYEWTDASFGGYDVLLSCDDAANARLCAAFEGCRMDAVKTGGKYWFILDSKWEEITPLRKAEYLHPEGADSPKGKELKKFRFDASAYSYRVYTDKELRK